MRLSILFTLILISSFLYKSSACGPYYPVGEDIRFMLLKPEKLNYPDFLEFSYAASMYYTPVFPGVPAEYDIQSDENVLLWRKRCHNIPSVKDTYLAIYSLDNEIKNSESSNTFVKYLYNYKDNEAIDYLIFAKQCSPYNITIDDPWERNENANVPQRGRLIKEALEKAENVADADLMRRYAFLAMRLSYYNNDGKVIKSTYEKYFSGHRANNIIDYWSMYFMVLAEEDKVKRNFYASQVFYYAPDKRHQLFFLYDKAIPVEETLKYAKTRDEENAVWMMAGFRKTGKSLDIIKNLYSQNPSQKGLTFLLLREVNKLEDWIYTPYYSGFNPSFESYRWEGIPHSDDKISEDREYAATLLDFVSSVNLRKVENPELWKLIKAYLKYMKQDYEGTLTDLSVLEKECKNNHNITGFISQIKSLCLVSVQKNATIPEYAKPVIMHELSIADNRFVFAVARELEFRGNTTDAALLLSKLKERVDKDDYENYWRNQAYWKTRENHFTLYVDYYEDYFFYLDAQYTPEQVADLINNINASKSNDRFEKWKYSVVKKDLPRLYDLLGTKYMRQNDLASAFREFANVNDTLWESDHFHYKECLDANPFYTNYYNEHQQTEADTVRYNKAEIAAKLIEYIDKGNDRNNKERDYYDFLAACCYFNMTQYGNSWMMKRYFWTSAMNKTGLEDDEDYFNCILARKYFIKAGRESRSSKFSALCLRMAGRCEGYRISYSFGDRYVKNEFYEKLKDQYPGYYDDLMSNCNSFATYFNSVAPGGTLDMAWLHSSSR